MTRRLIWFCFLFTFQIANILSQESTFDLFAKEGARHGIVNLYYPDRVINASVYCSGDTLINGVRYIEYTTFSGSFFKLYLYVDGFKVYKAFPDTGEKSLLYDFGAEVGDTIKQGYYIFSVITDKGIKVLDDGKKRIYYTLDNKREIVEGIGDLVRSIVGPFMIHDHSFGLLCYHDGNKILYQTENLPGDCDTMFCKKSNALFEFEKYDEKVHFKDLSVNAFQWHWDFGNGAISTVQNPVHVFESPGCKDVILTTWGECGFSSVRKYSVQYCQKGGWEVTNAIPNIRAPYFYFTDNRSWWEIYKSDSIRFTDDGGNSYSKICKLSDAFTISPRKFIVVDHKIFHDVLYFFVWNFENNSRFFLYISKDGGRNWKKHDLNRYWRNGAVDDKGNITLIDQKNIYISGDFGSTWDTIQKPTSVEIELSFIQDNGNIILVFYNHDIPQGYYFTTIEGNEISTEYSPIPAFHSIFRLDDNNFFLLDTDNKLYKSKDGLKSFVKISDKILDFFNPYLLFINENEWIVYDENHIYKTGNQGKDYEPLFCEFLWIEGVFVDRNGVARMITRSNNLVYIHEYVPLVASDDCVFFSNNSDFEKTEITIYPIPSPDFLHVEGISETYYFIIFDNLGNMVKNGMSHHSAQIDILDLAPGFYTIGVQENPNYIIYKKFIKN